MICVGNRTAHITRDERAWSCSAWLESRRLPGVAAGNGPRDCQELEFRARPAAGRTTSANAPPCRGWLSWGGSLYIQSSRCESLAAHSCNAFRYGLRFSSILSVGAEIPNANGDTPLSMGTAMQLRPG
jgi:hypothetical protein